MPSKTAIVFLLLFSVGCYRTIFISPFYGILLYEFEYFLNPIGRWWYGGLPVLRYSFILMFFLLSSYFLCTNDNYRNNRLSDAPQFKWLILMLVVMIFGYSWSIDTTVHTSLLIRYLKILAFVLLVYKVVDSPEKIEKLLAVYVAGIFYISWVGWQVGRNNQGRLEGIGGADTDEVNGAAAAVVTVVPIIAFFILNGKNRWIKVSSLLALVFVLNCLVLLNSRGAFIALVVSMLYFICFAFTEKTGKVLKIKIIIGAMVALCLFIYLADETFWLRMSTISNSEPAEGSGHRSLLWLKTFDMLKDHPFGLGAMGYQIASPKYLPAEWLTGGQRAVHSTWFEVLSESGYQGLLVFLGFVSSSFVLGIKVRRHLRAIGDSYHLLQCISLESAFLALLVAISFINYFHGELLYWLPMHIAAFANIHYFKAQNLQYGK